MAEFKFSCPRCGQHIQYDPRYSGTQINCPVCHQVIVVPQPARAGAPGSSPPGATKSRALQNGLIIAAMLVVVIGLVAVGWWGWSSGRTHRQRPSSREKEKLRKLCEMSNAKK